MRRLPLLVLAATLACTSEVTPQNPYDPATPLPLQAKARVSGTVETGASTPFAGLDVYLRQNGQLVRSFTTDAAGAFVFDSLTPGSYAVEAQAPGFAPVSIPLQLAAGATIDVGALALSPLGGADTGSLRGSALLGRMAAAPGDPVVPDPAADHGGILVESVGTPYAAVTTSTGDYELSLPPGRHSLRISHPGYIAQTLPDLQVTLGVASPVVVVVLATNPAKVTGQVEAELPDGSVGPLADALVTLEGTSATGLTNAAGQFTLDQLAPGSYLLRVLKAGYQTATVPVLNLIGGEERLLADPLRLALQRGSLRGTVALADTPGDASGVVVEVTGSGRAMVTGADGAFAFDALVAGPYEVRARRDGYGTQVTSGLAVSAGAVVDVPAMTLTRQGGTVAITEGAVTRSRTVTLQLGAPSAASWRASEDPAFQDAALGDTAGTHPYAGPGSSAPFTLSDRDGAHTVYVVFVDGAGGASAPASAAIVLDRLAPAAPSVTIETGAPFTRLATVGLTLSAQDLPASAGAAVSGLAKMELADNSAFTGSVLLDYNLAHTWSLAAGDGLKAVYARFLDRAGNQSATAVALVTLDTAGPQAPSLTLSGGAGAPAGTTGSPLVTAALSASDANEGTGKQDLQVRLSNASGFAGATWQPYAASVSWLLPPGDGAKTVFAQFMDPAGNQSLPVQATITMAGTAPGAGSLALAGGAAATRAQVVPVTLSATGASEMRLFVNGVAATGWLPYATSTTVDLGAAPDEATRTVSVSFRNAAGVEGGAASASIVFDQRAPTAPAVAVNGGAAFTASPTVTLALGALDAPALAGGYAAGLDTVELASDPAFTGATVLPYASTAPWTFTGADGAKTVWARFRDRAGNLSTAVSATVVLDTAGPSAPTLALSGGAGVPAGFTASPVVTATLSASDANEGAGKQNLEVRLGNDAGFSGATWQPYAATLSWVVPAGDGAKQVFAQFRDRAGNTSLPVSATITLVSAPPTGGALVLAGGATATNQASVAATVSAAGAAEMRFFVNGAASGGWVPYATTATVSLAGAPDEASAAVSVLFRSAAGVEGATAIATILVDRTAPTGGAVQVNGNAAWAGSTAVTLALSASDGPAAGPAASGLATVEVSNDAAFATLTAFPYAASIPWTLQAGADGARTVYVRFKDRAGNVSAAASDAVVLDTTGPTAPAISLAGNAGAQPGYSGTPVVTATLSATDVNEGAGKANLEVRLSNDAGFAGATWQPYATSLSWSLPGTDGLKTVYAQFRDAAGNQSLVTNATITLAATPPSAGSLTLAGGAAATNQATVTAALSAVGAAQMQLYVNGVASGGWVPYATSASVPLGASPDEATRIVAVAFRNAGGVEGGGASASILLDQAAPTAPAVVVNGGAPFTAGPGVTLALSASDGPALAGGVASGVATVEVANNGAFTGSSTYPVTDSLSWTLAAGGDGARTVHARFRDRAGNVSATATATITLDTTGPGAPTLALGGNPEAQAGYTGSAVVAATLSATDLNEGPGKQNLQVRLSNDSGFAGAAWQPYSTALPWVLPVGDGLKTVYAQFRDAAGNLSTVASATITLDATPPTGGAIAVAGGATATNQVSVPAVLSAVGAAQMQIYVNGAAQPGGWQPYAAGATVALGAAPDETSRTVSVVFRNFGGVEGGAAITSILLDRTAPLAPAVTVAGGAAFTGSTAVALALSASDGPSTGTLASGLDTVEVANNAAFTGSTTYAYATSLSWTLAAGGDGARTVWVRFKDKAGNVSAAASGGVTLDTTGPSAPSIALAGNATAQAGYTGTPVVTATLSATDVNEGAGKQNLQVRLSNDVGFSGATWQPYATSLPWVLPIGDGAKTVYAQFRDAVGNVSLPVNAGITLAETPPSAGTIAVAGGAPATNQQTVTASTGATGAARMQLYVNGVAQPGGFVPYATSALVDLGLAPDESTRTVSVVYRNAGGVDGGDALTTIVMDRTAPTSPALVINGGAAWTSAAAVTLAVSAQDGPATGTVASGLASVEVANNVAFTGSATFAMADTVPWTLPAGEGSKTVWVRFRDKAGNVSASTSAAIVRDTLGPTSPTLTMVGNTEASGGYTGTPVVTLTLSATDVNEGAGKANLQVRVANDVGFSGSNWQPYTTSMQWVLPTGDGTKTVYAQFRDAAGNLSATTSASIQLLATPPSGGSIVLAGGAAATAAATVPAAISASNAATMRLSVNGVAVTTWVAYATGTTVSLAGVPDQSTAVVTVSFRNLGGVEGGAATDAIRFDQTAPAAGALAITGTLGNGTTSNTLSATPAVTLAITPPGGDEVEMAVAQAATAVTACSASFVTPLWQPVSRSASLVLSGADGAKRACVVFRDAAGNFSTATAAAANVTLDTTPPTNPTYVNLVSGTQNAPNAPASGLPQVTASTDATAGGVVYQCTGGTGTRYGASWVDCGGATTLPFAYGLNANAQSTLGVRARDAAYNYSPGSFVQILHDDVAPFPPFITDIRSSRDTVTVTWDASGDTDVVDFLVWYGDAPGQLIGTGAAQGPSPVSVGSVNGQLTQSFTLTGLTQGLPYYVAIEAVDAAGNRSGKGGERSAVPSKANPRVLSTFAGLPRTLAMRNSLLKSYVYFAENQGVVQLDATADGATSAVGRAYLPDVVPDEGGSLPVFDCIRGATQGHCVVVSGTTSEGDYRGNHAAYRAPAHVVFFPLTGTSGAPVVGTIEAVLPVRPFRTAVATIAGEPVIVALHAGGMQAFSFKSGKLAFLKKVADIDPGFAYTAVHAAEVNGNVLSVFASSPDWGTAPFLSSYDLTFALAGTVGYAEYGGLRDAYGAEIGDLGAPFAVDLKGGVYAAVTDPFTDTAVAYRYAAGAVMPNATIALPSGAASDGIEPVAMTAGLNGHHFVYVSSGLGSPEFYILRDSGTFTYQATVGLQNDMTVAVAGPNLGNQERMVVLEGGPTGGRFAERFSIAAASGAHLAGADFSEVEANAFAEVDRFLYFANGTSIKIADAANPLSPQLVKVHTPGWLSNYWKIVPHGRYLYALSTSNGMDVYRTNPDGSLTWKGWVNLNVSAAAVVGRWAFLASGTTLYAYNTSNVASGSPAFITSLAVPGFTINALDARFRNSTVGLAQGGVGNPVPQAVIYAVSGGELRTFSFDGAAFTALATTTAAIGGATDITVRGDYAAVSTPTGAYRATVSNPSFLTVSGTVYPISGPTLLQSGYLVGNGAQGDPSGPNFAGFSAAGVDGAIRYSMCATSGLANDSHALTHVDGRYAASCGNNGVTLFTPVSVDGGRLLKSADVTPSWNTAQVGALAGDGMYNRIAGPTVPCSGCTDWSRIYTVSEQFTAEGTLSAPAWTSGNALGYYPPNQAFLADNLRYASFMQVIDGALYVVTGRPFSAPSVDVYDLGSSPWTYIGRYTFTGTTQASAIATDGEYLYVARNSPGTVEVLDLRNPVAITLRASIAASGGLDIASLAVARDRLYVGLRGSSQVRVYDVSAVQATGAITAKTAVSLYYSGDATGLAVVGGALFATQAVTNDAVAPYKLYTVNLSAADRDGLGASVAGFDTSLTPLRSPVVAGDVLYVASNLGTSAWDLTDYWRSRAAPVARGGANLADPFGSAAVQLRIDGPFASMVGGVYRVFDLR